MADKYNQELIKIINIPLGICSIIGCLVIITSFICIRKIRSFVLELVFYLSICCLFHQFSYMIFYPTNDEDSEKFICKFQGFSMLLFGAAQFIWTSLISFSIFQSVIFLRDISTKNSNSRRYVYILIGFGIPIILGLVGSFIDVYGKSGFWCYIKQNAGQKSSIFFIVNYVLIWICILLNLVLYTIVIRFIKKHLQEEEKEKMKRYINSLISYSVIQIIIVLPATINRIYQLASHENIIILDFIQSAFDCSQGLAYSIVYGFNPTVREAIISRVQNFFTRRKSNSSINSRKDSQDTENSLKSNINFTRITLIDKNDDIMLSD